MALSTPPADGGPDIDTTDLAEATSQLRGRAHPRAAEVAERVLRTALAGGRRSLPVRARAPHEHVRVSTGVLVTLLRAEVDPALVGAAVGRIAVSTDREDLLTELTVELFVQYGTEIPALADRVRELARGTLDASLGPGTAAGVDITVTHVHVSDVTLGDPHLVDPTDG